MLRPNLPPSQKIEEILLKLDALAAYPQPYRYFTDLHSSALELLAAYGKSSHLFGTRTVFEHQTPDARLTIKFKQTPDKDNLIVEAERGTEKIKAVLFREKGVQTRKFLQQTDSLQRFLKGCDEYELVNNTQEMEPKKVEIHKGRSLTSHHYS